MISLPRRSLTSPPASAFRLCLPGIRPSLNRRRPGIRSKRWSKPFLGEEWAEGCSYGRMARANLAFGNHAESINLRPHRRHRRGRHHFAAGENRWRAQLGLSAVLVAGFDTHLVCARPKRVHREARDWGAWLLRAVAGLPGSTRIMYGLAGERRLPELELDWLPGYEDSRPVRIGNAAVEQFQLDVFGEVVDTLYRIMEAGLQPLESTWRITRALVSFVERSWDQPDEGIWEVRGGRRHFTHSKILCWVALDRAIRAVEDFGVAGPVERWKALAAQIHADVCARGFDSSRNTFVQSYGSKLLDASLLLIPMLGFLPAHDSRVLGTLKAVEQDLLRDGFVERYHAMTDDGLPPGEGTFLACSFWYADNLHLCGREQEAREVFQRLLSVCNDVGLLAEEYDPHAKRFLGNFPQAFSHVGLINTALNLTPAEGHPAEQRASRAASAKRRAPG